MKQVPQAPKQKVKYLSETGEIRGEAASLELAYKVKRLNFV